MAIYLLSVVFHDIFTSLTATMTNAVLERLMLCCCVGERISKAAQDCVAGGGCCVRNGYVYATLAGFVHSSRNSDGMVRSRLTLHRNRSQHERVYILTVIILLRLVCNTSS